MSPGRRVGRVTSDFIESEFRVRDALFGLLSYWNFLTFQGIVAHDLE